MPMSVRLVWKREAAVSTDQIKRFSAGAAVWQILCPPAYGVDRSS
jgi:hypothetical protein